MNTKSGADQNGGQKMGKNKTWTIMAYLAGSNNLVDEMVFAVRELRGKPFMKFVNVYVEFDTGSDVWLFPPTAFQGRAVTDTTTREDIDLEGVAKKQHYKHLLSTQGILRDFVTKSMLDSVTDHYMLILSGHGSGAVGDFLTGGTPGLTVPSLRVAFDRVKTALKRKAHKRGKPGVKLFDILGLDSCTMSMAEIGYEVEQHVHYMVGAEGFEPNTGWPYDRLIKLDLQRPAGELAVDIAKAYSEYYFNYSIGDLSTDQSALNLDGFGKTLQPVVHKLARVLKENLEDRSAREGIIFAHWRAQSYKREQYTDLWDFCGQLMERFRGNIRVAAKDVQDAIDQVVMLSTYSGSRFQHSHGVAIYFPWADIVDLKGVHDLAAYRLLKFGKRTDWASFLDEYFKKTQRPSRVGQGARRSSHLNTRPGLLGTFAKFPINGGGATAILAGGANGNFPDEIKGGSDEGDKGGSDEGDKFGLQLRSLKIGEMKNPPTDWYRDKIHSAQDVSKK